MKQIRNDSEIDNQYSKMASIKTDYEAGIQSKVDIAKKHSISTVTLGVWLESKRASQKTWCDPWVGGPMGILYDKTW